MRLSENEEPGRRGEGGGGGGAGGGRGLPVRRWNVNHTCCKTGLEKYPLNMLKPKVELTEMLRRLGWVNFD